MQGIYGLIQVIGKNYLPSSQNGLFHVSYPYWHTISGMAILTGIRILLNKVGIQPYTGMRLQALAERNIRLNIYWIDS